MTRKWRYEKEDGLYHVINRGNYRQSVFGSVGAARAFETTLWEAVKLYEWRIHAYVLMSNHYHLAVETPLPNLGEGMHWLQSTFATRFNRFRKEQGHLFQGRYKALAVENDAALARVVDYIHLNPVRAQLVDPPLLDCFRWSSLRCFVRDERPSGLIGERIMAFWQTPDNKAGWSEYLVRLKELATDEAEQKRMGMESLSKGWAIGTDSWKAELAKTFTERKYLGMAREEALQMKEARWQAVFKEHCARLGKTDKDLSPLKPCQRDEPWRWELAQALRNAGASYAWIAVKLHYPSASSLRVRMHREKSVNN
jgi:putative transposase